MSRDEEESRFDAIASQFAAARGAGVALRCDDYRICGETARISIAGAALAAAILPSLGHLRVAAAAGEAPLRIDLWDVGESGVRGLPRSQCLARGRRWDLLDGRFAASADGRFVSHELRSSVVWLDRRRGRIAGWYEDGATLRLHERGKPLQMLLALRASDLGLQAVHGACVAHANGGGVLLPANSGAGKSTAALACLRAGYSCLGDDWVGLARPSAGVWIGHGLYSSLFLERSHARRFADVLAHLVPPAAGEDKGLLLAAPLFPGRLAASARIHAVAIPRFRAGRGTTLRAASRAEVLLALVPSSVFSLRPRLGRDAVGQLATLAEEVDGYVLETGTDLDEIPRALERIFRKD